MGYYNFNFTSQTNIYVHTKRKNILDVQKTICKSATLFNNVCAHHPCRPTRFSRHQCNIILTGMTLFNVIMFSLSLWLVSFKKKTFQLRTWKTPPPLLVLTNENRLRVLHEMRHRLGSEGKHFVAGDLFTICQRCWVQCSTGALVLDGCGSSFGEWSEFDFCLLRKFASLPSQTRRWQCNAGVWQHRNIVVGDETTTGAIWWQNHQTRELTHQMDLLVEFPTQTTLQGQHP